MTATINDGGPAFPHVKLDDGTRFIDGVLYIKQTGDTGMSLRAWLAGQAISGLAMQTSDDNATADWAVNLADAVIKRLEQP